MQKETLGFMVSEKDGKTSTKIAYNLTIVFKIFLINFRVTVRPRIFTKLLIYETTYKNHFD